MYGGLLAISVVTLIAILGKNHMDRSLLLAVYAFAVAIPLIATCYFTEFIVTSFVKAPKLPVLMQGIALLGTLTALLGLVGLFLHFSVVAGVVFTLCCLVGIVIIGTGVLILYQAEEAIPKLKDEDHDVSEVSKRISSSLPEIRSNFL